jgi:ABC-2 type transport system permease protein
MRFGARRRPAGKHAGERTGRRRRPSDVRPEETTTPPTDSAGGDFAAPPPHPPVAEPAWPAPEAPIAEPEPRPEPVTAYAPPSVLEPEPELVPAALGAPVEIDTSENIDDTRENPAIREARQEARREERREGRRERRRQNKAEAESEESEESEESDESEESEVAGVAEVAPPEPELRVVRDVATYPLTPPTANNGLLAVFQKRYLLKLLVRREISARYQGSFLGLLWSYIGPLCQFFIYWFVLGTIIGLHKNVENFGVHIFCGLVVVHFFTETFSAGTRSIVRNKSIVVKLPLPREMFPVASMLVSLFHVFPQMVILLAACLVYGWTPDPYGMACLALAFLIAMLLGTAGALLFSAANVFFRDFGNVVSIMTMFIRFSVPMIYPYSLVDERFGDAARYYLWNPLADCVLLVQRALWLGTTSDPAAIEKSDLPPDLLMWGLLMSGVGLVSLAIGQLVFSRLESRIPERL